MQPLNFTRSINQLAQENWLSRLPDPHESAIKGAKPERKKMEEIVEMVNDSLKNNQDTASAKKVAHKCWKYATHTQDPKEAIRLCEICYEKLSAKAETDKDKVNRTTFEFQVEGKTFKLPGYYKSLLANVSPFFKGLFESQFNEKGKDVFQIGEVSAKDFDLLLKLFSGESLPSNEMDLEDLVNLIKTSERLNLKNITHELVQLLETTISGLADTPENQAIVKKISDMFQATSLKDDMKRLHFMPASRKVDPHV